jgi:hypothetical protein
MVTTDDYLSRITSQHRDKPLFTAVVRALTEAFAATTNLELGLPEAFNLDTAVGAQLDAVGLWIGLGRRVSVPLEDVYFEWDGPAVLGWDSGSWQGPFDPDSGLVMLPDDAYRAILRAKVAANHWDGTIPGAYDAWAIAFSGGQVIILQDHQDMSMTVGFVGPPLPAIEQALLVGSALPLKPMGVRIRYFAIPANSGPLFGWNVNNAVLAGWGTGSWPIELTPTT